MRYAKCGSDNREGRKFCSKCEHQLQRSCKRCSASNLPGHDVAVAVHITSRGRLPGTGAIRRSDARLSAVGPPNTSRGTISAGLLSASGKQPAGSGRGRNYPIPLKTDSITLRN